MVGAPMAARCCPARSIRAASSSSASCGSPITLFMRAVLDQRDGLLAHHASGCSSVGMGLPLFFLPLTQIALASVDPEETAGAAGRDELHPHALERRCHLDRQHRVGERRQLPIKASSPGCSTARSPRSTACVQSGMSHDQAVGTLTNLAYGQAVMLLDQSGVPGAQPPASSSRPPRSGSRRDPRASPIPRMAH